MTQQQARDDAKDPLEWRPKITRVSRARRAAAGWSSFSPKSFERLKERRSDQRSRDGAADRRLGLAQRQAVGLADGGHRLVQVVGVPQGEAFERVDRTLEDHAAREGRCAITLAKLASSNARLVEEKELDHRRYLARTSRPALERRVRCARRWRHVELVFAPGRLAVARPPRARPGSHPRRAASTNSSLESARMYSPFMWRQLLHVEEGWRVRDVLQAKLLDQRRQRHDLVVPAGAPAEQGQVVHEGVRQIPLVAVASRWRPGPCAWRASSAVRSPAGAGARS